MTKLLAAQGPDNPPSSRPHTGVLRGKVFKYTFNPAQGVVRLAVPGFEKVAITENTVVKWAFYADGKQAALRPYPALAVTVDFVMEDGKRLSDDYRVRDLYDYPMGPDQQFKAQWSFPEQWSADMVSLAPLANDQQSEKTSDTYGALEVVLGAEALKQYTDCGDVTGFVEFKVDEVEPQSTDSLARIVDTRRGSHATGEFSRGNTVPLFGVPHGFTFLTPVTDATDSRWPYKYSIDDDPQGRRLEAIQFSHIPSPWMDDRGVLQVMPFSGGKINSPVARRRWIVPGTEKARPFGYSALLDDGESVQATATDHAGLFRAKAESADAEIGMLLDQFKNEGSLEISEDGHFEGWIPGEEIKLGNGPRTYFYGQTITNVARTGMLKDSDHSQVSGFVTSVGTIEVRIAQSFISAEQAHKNLELEAPLSLTFDEVSRKCEAQWNDVLSAVKLPDLPEQDKPYRLLAHREDCSKMASSLYRVELYPNSMTENIGSQASPELAFENPMATNAEDGKNGSLPCVKGSLMVNNGYWDTYRTEWSLLSFLYSKSADAMLDGILTQYKAGGWMARWSSPGYVDLMVGTSSDQIFADAKKWGLMKNSIGEAFDSGWKNACEPSPDPRYGRKGIQTARFTGYVPTSVKEGMSWSLENSMSDAGLGHLARDLAKDATSGSEESARWLSFARYFDNRSLAYRSLFDASEGFFRGKQENGQWRHADFDPRGWGGDYVETNAWGMSVSVVHDGTGLAQLYGGPEKFRNHLEKLFSVEETADKRFAVDYGGTVIHEQREARALRMGMCGISNQPAHHIPYMWLYTDQPWRSAGIVNAMAKRLFSGSYIGQGFPGDEDNGEMSAFWIWAALGLYPLELGSGVLRIGSPLFDDISIRRNTGNMRITSHRESADSHVLEKVVLNGQELSEPVLPVKSLLSGDVTLELFFSHDYKNTNTLWSVPRTTRVWKRDLTGQGGNPVASDAVTNPANAFDDGNRFGDSGVALNTGEWIGWSFGKSEKVTDVTLTVLDTCDSSALQWQYQAPGSDQWTDVEMTHSEQLLLNRTTPFTLAHGVECTSFRLIARKSVKIRQIELFSLD